MKYTVKKGDSLWKIANQYLGGGHKYTEIMQANNLSENSIIHPGDVLIIPESRSEQTQPKLVSKQMTRTQYTKLENTYNQLRENLEIQL